MPAIQIKEMNGKFACSQVTMPDGETRLFPRETLEISDEDWQIMLASEAGNRLQIASEIPEPALPEVPEEELAPAKHNAQTRKKAD